MVYPEQAGVLEFPIVVNDNISSMLVRTNPEGVHLKIVGIDGVTKFEQSY